MTTPVFCHHANAVQTVTDHPGGMTTWRRERKARSGKVKRGRTQPMRIAERRCPDCGGWAAMTVPPGWSMELELAAVILGQHNGTAAEHWQDCTWCGGLDCTPYSGTRVPAAPPRTPRGLSAP